MIARPSEELAAQSSFSASLHAARFFAAVGVLITHTGFLALAEAGAPNSLLTLIQSRSLLTSFFFLLSGFLLVRSVSRKAVPYTAFLVRRVTRLYPLHITCFLLTSPVAFVGTLRHTLPEFGFHVVVWGTMLHGFFPQLAYEYNVPAWAITSFVLGYLLIPYTVRLSRCSTRWLLGVMAILWVVILLPNLAVLVLQWNDFRYSMLKPNDLQLLTAAVHSTPFVRVPEILIGAILALVVSRSEVYWLISWMRRDWCVVGLVATLAGIGFVDPFDDRWRYLVGHGPALPLLALILVGLSSNGGWIDRFCRAGFLQRGGASAIILYFAHWPVYRAVCLGAIVFGGMTLKQAESSLLVFGLTASAAVTTAVVLQPHYDRFCRRLADVVTARLIPRGAGWLPGASIDLQAEARGK